jgi:hypothetical protein
MSMRLEAITWPVQEGMGVYFRYWNGTTFTTVDLSNHVVYETGESTLDVGAAQRKLTTDATPAAVQARISAAGVLGYAEVTANQATITSEVDLTGLTSTVTVGTSRRIQITAVIRFGVTNANNNALLRIKESTTVLQIGDQESPRTSATANHTIMTSRILTPSAGPHTYKLSLEMNAGTGSISMIAGTTNPAFILVEDIGPA